MQCYVQQKFIARNSYWERKLYISHLRHYLLFLKQVKDVTLSSCHSWARWMVKEAFIWLWSCQCPWLLACKSVEPQNGPETRRWLVSPSLWKFFHALAAWHHCTGSHWDSWLLQSSCIFPIGPKADYNHLLLGCAVDLHLNAGLQSQLFVTQPPSPPSGCHRLY